MENEGNKIIEKLEETGIFNDKLASAHFVSMGKIMSDYSNVVAEDYLRSFSSDAEYNKLTFGAQMFFPGAGNNASYANGFGAIFIDPKFYFNREDIALLLSHEATHHGQNQLANTDPKILTKDGQEHQAVIGTGILDHDSSSFGIRTSGKTYVNPSSWKNTEHYLLATATYVLSPIEREARLAELKTAELFGIEDGRGDKSSGAYYELTRSLEIIKDRYHCHNLSNAEVCNALDNAFVNVTTGNVPTNPLEASMTYDIASFVYGQNIFTQGEAIRLLDPDVKAATMYNSGFENTFTISDQEAQLLSEKQIVEMSKETLSQNPNVIAFGICTYGIEAMSKSDYINQELSNGVIGDTAFDRWYFSENNTLSDVAMELIADQLGLEYSRSNVDLVISGEEIITFSDNYPTVDLDSLFNENNSNEMDQIMSQHSYEIDQNDEWIMEIG